MAGTAKAAPGKGSGKQFWKAKLGPFPVWVWGIGVGAVGVYYWYTHYGPGASKSNSSSGTGQKGSGARRGAPERIRVVETVRQYGQGRRWRRRTVRGGYDPAVSAAAAQGPAQSPAGGGPGPGGTMAGLPAPPGGPDPGGLRRPGPHGPNPGGPDKRPGRRRGRRDRQRRESEVIDRQSVTTTTATGQPVDAQTGQPVYWEWQHKHRGPEVATPHPVPEPQQAYAPMTSGGTYDAASAAAGLAG